MDEKERTEREAAARNDALAREALIQGAPFTKDRFFGVALSGALSQAGRNQIYLGWLQAAEGRIKELEDEKEEIRRAGSAMAEAPSPSWRSLPLIPEIPDAH